MQNRYFHNTKRFLIAVFPPGVTATTFLWPILFDNHWLPGTNINLLTGAMQIEMVLIGGGLLFMPFLLIPVQSRVSSLVRTVLFLVLTIAFASASHDMGGWQGFVSFYLLLYVSYGGSVLFMKDFAGSNWIAMQFAARWMVSLIFFFSLFVYFEPPNNVESWRGSEAVLHFGAAFFSVLLLLEVALYVWTQSALNKAMIDKGLVFEPDKTGEGSTLEARQKYFNAVHRKK